MDEEVSHRLERLRDSGDGEGLAQLGESLWEQEALRDAEVCLRAAAGSGSGHGAYVLGNLLAHQERWNEALAAYEQALDRGWAQAWLNTGHALYELHDLAGALRAYRKAADDGDSDGDVYQAFLLRELGEQEDAEQVMARAAAAGNALAAAALAAWAWDTTADRGLEAALRAGAEHYSSARASLASLLRATGRDGEAQAVLERGTELGEDVCWLPLGNLYDEILDDQQAAERAYRAGIAAGDAYSHHNLAVLLHRLGREEEALHHLRMAAAAGDELAARTLANVTDDAGLEDEEEPWPGPEGDHG